MITWSFPNLIVGTYLKARPQAFGCPSFGVGNQKCANFIRKVRLVAKLTGQQNFNLLKPSFHRAQIFAEPPIYFGDAVFVIRQHARGQATFERGNCVALPVDDALHS